MIMIFPLQGDRNAPAAVSPAYLRARYLKTKFCAVNTSDLEPYIHLTHTNEECFTGQAITWNRLQLTVRQRNVTLRKII